MATTTDFRNGMVINQDKELYLINYFQHVKPGKGGAFVRTKLKNVKTGAIIDKTFRAGEKVEEVRLEKREMQYLYKDGQIYYLMDSETFEQYPISANLIADAARFLKENEKVFVLMDNDVPITFELPFFVEIKVVDTDPGIRGDTATGGTKPATLETGAVVQVPLFINIGDTLKIDTRTGEYIERV